MVNLNYHYPIKRLRSPLSASAPPPSYRVISSSTTMSARLLWIKLSICCGHIGKNEEAIEAVIPYNFTKNIR